MTLRRHYWNPRTEDIPHVNEEYPLYAFNRRQPAGTWSDRHQHDQWGELAYPVSGSIVVYAEKGSYLGSQDRAIWIPPGLQHEWYLPEPATNRSLFIHLSALDYAPRFYQYHVVEILPLVRELILAIGDYDLNMENTADRHLTQVLLERLTLSGVVEAPLLMPRDRRLVELCTSVLTTPDLQTGLRDWSCRLGMSDKTLARHFKRETGMTFGRWVQNIRLQRALYGIESGENITTVALNCGYNSISAFIVAFKRQFGKTPGAFSTRQATMPTGD